ncbi:hypothetical protein AB3R30_12305 [Leptolyngbyaceae cyanobacterium UHCC 1019]
MVAEIGISERFKPLIKLTSARSPYALLPIFFKNATYERAVSRAI